MTMKIGQIENSGVPGRRDAFHVPAVLVASEENLRPGDDIRFTDDSYTMVRRAERSERHAVADPFVNDIPKGSLFWALLMPNLVSNLVHHFNLTTDVNNVGATKLHSLSAEVLERLREASKPASQKKLTETATVIPNVEAPVPDYDWRNDPTLSDWDREDMARCNREGCT